MSKTSWEKRILEAEDSGAGGPEKAEYQRRNVEMNYNNFTQKMNLRYRNSEDAGRLGAKYKVPSVGRKLNREHLQGQGGPKLVHLPDL